MPEQCDKCGVEYTPMILERFAKGSKVWYTLEIFSYVCLGGYALACYYFSSSVVILLLCAVFALILYHLFSPKDKGFCDTCVEEKGTHK